MQCDERSALSWCALSWSMWSLGALQMSVQLKQIRSIAACLSLPDSARLLQLCAFDQSAPQLTDMLPLLLPPHQPCPWTALAASSVSQMAGEWPGQGPMGVCACGAMSSSGAPGAMRD